MSWKLGSDIISRLLQYMLFWAAARQLGQAEFGDFTFALSTGYMLAQIADFGLQLYVQRELSRLAIPGAVAQPYFSEPALAARLVGGALMIKTGLSLLALLAVAIVVVLTPVQNKPALVLIGLSMVLATLLEYFAYCFRALQRLKLEAITLVLARSTNLLLGAGLLLLGGGVLGLAVAGNVAMLLAVLVSYRLLTRYVRPSWQFDARYWRRRAWQPTALGVGVLFSMLTFRIDNLLIVPIAGREALGIYNAAYKLFEPSLFVPSVLLAALFPLLARAGDASPTRPAVLRHLLGQTALAMVGLGAVACLAFAVFAVPLVTLLYGAEYAAAAYILQLLAIACVPMYLNYAMTHALIALDRPQLYAAFTLAALAVNLSANLALLPVLGIAGAAMATVAAEVVLFALCAGAVLRLTGRVREAGPAVGSVL